MAEAARETKFSEQAIYNGRMHFVVLAPSDANRLRALEFESARKQGQAYLVCTDGDLDEARMLRSLQAVACPCHTAFGPRAGQEVLRVQGGMPGQTNFKQTLCADTNGFGLHAVVCCGADDSQALEQLCRYITRPPLANERVETDAVGQMVLKPKTVWCERSSHLVMSQLGSCGRCPGWCHARGCT